jgi:hypothetical protein
MKLMSITACARFHGVARGTIYNAINRGELASIPLEGGGRVIREDACKSWSKVDRKETGKRGAAARWGAKKDATKD